MKQHLNILLADDDPDDHELFHEALKATSAGDVAAGGLVSLASVYNGKQALDYLLKRGQFANRKEGAPDILVLDLNMPVMGGLETLKQIQENPVLKSIPVYILTTSVDEKDEAECWKLGCAGFFTKPTQLTVLSRHIQKMLAGVGAE